MQDSTSYHKDDSAKQALMQQLKLWCLTGETILSRAKLDVSVKKSQIS